MSQDAALPARNTDIANYAVCFVPGEDHTRDMQAWSLGSIVGANSTRAAVRVDGEMYDVAMLTARPEWAATRCIIDNWDAASRVISRALSEPKNSLPPGERVLGAPLEPRTVYCIGANYQQHVDNVARYRGLPSEPSAKMLGVGPFHFLKSNNCVVPTGSAVAAESASLDFEAELAVVIGQRARNIPVANALEVVAGYTIGNDLSARDRIVRNKLSVGSPFRYDWSAHKNFDGACPLGPWLVPAAFIKDPQALDIRTWVNGELRQSASSADMTFSVAEIIADIASRITLMPGDVILTGTPEGVGAETGRFLAAGDFIRIEIAGLGTLETRIVAASE